MAKLPPRRTLLNPLFCDEIHVEFLQTTAGLFRECYAMHMMKFWKNSVKLWKFTFIEEIFREINLVFVIFSFFSINVAFTKFFSRKSTVWILRNEPEIYSHPFLVKDLVKVTINY